MDTDALRDWARVNGSHLEGGADKQLSLTSKLVRFRWSGCPTIAVGRHLVDGKDTIDGKTRINAVLDGVAWFLARREQGDDTLNLLLAADEHGEVPREHLDAIGTLVSSLADGPAIRLWVLGSDGQPAEQTPRPAKFTTQTPQRWADMLVGTQLAPAIGLAKQLVEAIGHPSVALYPKLSSQKAIEPWQLRVDGLDIGRVSATSGTLRLATRELGAAGRPRDQWRQIVGKESQPFDAQTLAPIVDTVHKLIAAWSAHLPPGSVLDHGQPEHGLEAHVLSGRLRLLVGGHTLRLAAPCPDSVLRTAQFPTLWGNVAYPARYLDALLADDDGRPWAVELKDQGAGGGHGAYLRAGIGQAVLYRHYIRSVEVLSPWFETLDLLPTRCEAALAFPTMKSGAANTVGGHLEVARLCGVHVIQFPRPGSDTMGTT